MPKESRRLGVDRPTAPKVFQGVVAPADFPQAKLDVSLDSILEQQNSHAQAQPIDAQQPAVAGNPEFMDVPVNLIDPSPFQPRLDITDDELQLLANSISVARRVNRPISLRIKPNGRYELIGGERRWRSGKRSLRGFSMSMMRRLKSSPSPTTKGKRGLLTLSVGVPTSRSWIAVRSHRFATWRAVLVSATSQ